MIPSRTIKALDLVKFVFSLFFIYQIVIGTIIITKTIQYTSEKHPKKNNNPHTRIIMPNIKLCHNKRILLHVML